MDNKILDGSDLFFGQESDIEFLEEEHRYIYKTGEDFMPVSHLYHLFFEEFDKEATAKRVAERQGRCVEEILEEWDAKRNEAAEIGKFMHSQIEHDLKSENYSLTIHFNYNGRFIQKDMDVDISREIGYYKNFRQQLSSRPFRAEWCVCDPRHKVAGTIDLLCRRDDGSFDMYDWKRSPKIDPSATAFKRGINGLQHLNDCQYIHYSLQQNLYRYMLETYYGIRVNSMHLVVLHPEKQNFIMIPIKRMDREVKIMLECKDNIVGRKN